MKKRILIGVLAMALVFGMSACTKKDTADETQMSTVETTDTMETTETVEETENIEETSAGETVDKAVEEETSAAEETEKKETPAVTSSAAAEKSADSESDKQETPRGIEPGEDEVGNFEGLETTDEINMDLQDGEKVIGG